MNIFGITRQIAYTTSNEAIQLALAMGKFDFSIIIDLAENTNLSYSVQLILVKYSNKVRMFLSENPAISEETQLILARDDYWVRYYLEGNPNLFESARLIIEKMKNNDIGYKLNMSYISEHDKMIISGKVK